MVTTWGLSSRGWTWQRVENLRILTTWLVNFRTLRMSEIFSIKILESTFPFKTYFSTLMHSLWPSETPSKNTIRTRNKLLWSGSRHFRPARFNLVTKNCWHQREKIFYLHLCWTRPASFPKKSNRFKKNSRSISRSRLNMKWWHSQIEEGRWRKTEGLSNSTDSMS